jgi:hypothetical protein
VSSHPQTVINSELPQNRNQQTRPSGRMRG